MRKFLLVLVLLLFSTSFCYQFYFANLHAHTAYSDGVGTPEEAFEHARRYVHVQAITDHAEYFGQKIDGQDKLLLTKAAAKRATTKDFVALWGFEWTGGVGHINVYCTDEWIDRTRSLKELYEWIVKKKGARTVQPSHRDVRHVLRFRIRSKGRRVHQPDRGWQR